MIWKKNTWLLKRYPKFLIEDYLNKKYEIQGSPTLIINEKKIESFKSDRSENSIIKFICNAFINDKPKICDKILNGESGDKIKQNIKKENEHNKKEYTVGKKDFQGKEFNIVINQNQQMGEVAYNVIRDGVGEFVNKNELAILDIQWYDHKLNKWASSSEEFKIVNSEFWKSQKIILRRILSNSEIDRLYKIFFSFKTGSVVDFHVGRELLRITYKEKEKIRSTDIEGYKNHLLSYKPLIFFKNFYFYNEYKNDMIAIRNVDRAKENGLRFLEKNKKYDGVCKLFKGKEDEVECKEFVDGYIVFAKINNDKQKYVFCKRDNKDIVNGVVYNINENIKCGDDSKSNDFDEKYNIDLGCKETDNLGWCIKCYNIEEGIGPEVTEYTGSIGRTNCDGTFDWSASINADWYLDHMLLGMKFLGKRKCYVKFYKNTKNDDYYKDGEVVMRVLGVNGAGYGADDWFKDKKKYIETGKVKELKDIWEKRFKSGPSMQLSLDENVKTTNNRATVSVLVNKNSFEYLELFYWKEGDFNKKQMQRIRDNESESPMKEFNLKNLEAGSLYNIVIDGRGWSGDKDRVYGEFRTKKK